MRQEKWKRLAALFHHRWSVPILAELHHATGAKFVTLVKRMGISRGSLTATLEVLIEQGWVMRNPGHGHPLRPEYVLTAAGARFAVWCVRLMKVVTSLGVRDVCLKKWSLPVALILADGRSRFSQLRASMPDLTARALTLTLKQLQSSDLVKRTVSDEYPPATYYGLTQRGRRLARHVHLV